MPCTFINFLENFMFIKNTIKIAFLTSALCTSAIAGSVTLQGAQLANCQGAILSNSYAFSDPQFACAVAWCLSQNSGGGGAATSCSNANVTNVTTVSALANGRGEFRCSISATCAPSNTATTCNYNASYQTTGSQPPYGNVQLRNTLTNTDGKLSCVSQS